MKCAEVPVLPVLEFVAKVERGETFWYPPTDMVNPHGERVAHFSACSFPGFENSLSNCVPKGVSALGVAKILIRDGLLDGCTCGCRGDFTLTDAGRAAISSQSITPARGTDAKEELTW